MIWGCGGWRSGMPPTTSTSSPRWPARTAGGPAPGMTTTGYGRPARRRNGGSGCGQPLRLTAPPRAARVLVRERYSTVHPDQVTGYAVGLSGHTARDGGVVWYGGGKLAADLTLPKLRARWSGTAAGRAPFDGSDVPAAA